MEVELRSYRQKWRYKNLLRTFATIDDLVYLWKRKNNLNCTGLNLIYRVQLFIIGEFLYFSIKRILLIFIRWSWVVSNQKSKFFCQICLVCSFKRLLQCQFFISYVASAFWTGGNATWWDINQILNRIKTIASHCYLNR